MDQVPVLLASAGELPQHVKTDTAAGPMHFRLADVIEPSASSGLPLVPFFRLHDERYQMYWQLTTKEKIAAKRDLLAAEERTKALREANTLDRVAPGEQQPEVEHDYLGQNSDSGLRNGRRWRRGDWFQYTLSAHGEKSVELAVTYWGGDVGRAYDIFVNGELLATETVDNSKPNQYFEKHYSLPAKILSGATNDRITIKFSAKPGTTAGGVYDVRLMRPDPGAGVTLPSTPASI
jgi:hypothetical protein